MLMYWTEHPDQWAKWMQIVLIILAIAVVFAAIKWFGKRD